MRLDPAIFAERAVPYEFEHFVRVMPVAHQVTLLGSGDDGAALAKVVSVYSGYTESQGIEDVTQP